jgi:nucleotide-binding universal stress UspA family protein
MLSRLLVPLDGSRLAESVLPWVARLATAGDSTVLLLHVIERGAPAAVHGERHLKTVTEASPYLEDLAATLRASGITVQTHAHPAPEGDVSRSIVEHSHEQEADLVILCTHGRGSMRDLLFGRIAQQVLRRGTTPVLLIRPRDDGEATPFEPGSVLVPLDGSPDAEAALGPARELARSLDAPLHLVTVVPTQETLRGDRQAVGTLLPAATRAELDLEQTDTESYLAALAAAVSAESAGLPVTTEVLRGDVDGSLAQRATAPGVGLVVMATHGRAGLGAVWGGSVAAPLLSHLRVPILLIRNVSS